MSYSIDFDYKIIYARRRTISVKIGDDNSITVRCPVGTPKVKIEQFLCDKSGWLKKYMARNLAAMHQFEDVMAYREVLVGGQPYRLVLGDMNAMRESVVTVKNMSALKGVYVKALGGEFMTMFKNFADCNGFTFSSVSFKSYRGRWGCCDINNNITFNYKLLMLPRKLWLAVIAHELCHTRRHDHSSEFHRLLDEVYPDNKTSERLLKRYSFVARLY